jgi:hypothetical protein
MQNWHNRILMKHFQLELFDNSDIVKHWEKMSIMIIWLYCIFICVCIYLYVAVVIFIDYSDIDKMKDIQND